MATLVVVFPFYMLYLVWQRNLTNLHVNKCVENWDAAMKSIANANMLVASFPIASMEWETMDELSNVASISEIHWIVVELNGAKGNSKSTILSHTEKYPIAVS